MEVPTIINNHAYPVAASRTTRPVIDRNSELYKASQDFEALFIKQMLDVMRRNDITHWHTRFVERLRTAGPGRWSGPWSVASGQ